MTWPDDIRPRDLLGPEPERRSYLEPRDPGDEGRRYRCSSEPERRAALAQVTAIILRSTP